MQKHKKKGKKVENNQKHNVIEEQPLPKQNVMDDPLLPQKSLFRVEEAAQYFGVAKSTIYLWIDHGILKAEKYKIDHTRPGGAMIRIPRVSLLRCRFNARFDPML